MHEGDRLLVQAMRSGDDAVYKELIDQYYPAMKRLAYGYVRDPDLAEDVIQETWIAVMNGIDRFEGRSSLKTWIFRILRNCARTKAARWNRISGDGEGAALQACPQGCPETYLLGREIVEQVEAAVQRLPDSQRDVLILRDVEGWTSEETCELLGISRIHQRVLLHRARMAVREALGPYLAAEAYDEVG